MFLVGTSYMVDDCSRIPFYSLGGPGKVCKKVKSDCLTSSCRNKDACLTDIFPAMGQMIWETAR